MARQRQSMFTTIDRRPTRPESGGRAVTKPQHNPRGSGEERTPEGAQPLRLPRIYSDELDAHGRGYPRPQLRRASWSSLNGEWEFAFDAAAQWRLPSEVEWTDRILVPFAPETEASGLANTGFYRACWYRREFVAPERAEGERLVLHFGAVDHTARVWVDGAWVGSHEGGYTPFSIDITDLTSSGERCEVVVHAYDDPHDLTKPRGKQDWQLEPHAIWYPRTTGIWQTVWLETLPATYLSKLAFTSNLARWEIGIEAWAAGPDVDGSTLSVSLSSRGEVLAADTYSFVSGEVRRRIALSDPGIDDSRNELLWSPRTPNLIDVVLELRAPSGELLERITSYTALRSTGVQGDRFLLNNRPYRFRMVLDQGYWDKTGLTAPNDEALRRDVLLAKEMGFNGVRKHQKVEDPRYLYWADRLGLAVWGEMPSAYRFTHQSIERLTAEWTEVINRDFSHPSIICWVPINESWGTPNLTDNPSERHYVQALYHMTHALDPGRPVLGNDGWESVATDIIGIHDYDDRPERLGTRYRADELLQRLTTRERPGGRIIVLEGQHHGDRPLFLTEFGGITLSSEGERTWGYSRSHDAEEFKRAFNQLLEVVRNLDALSGFCYTQFADTYQEANGLLYSDRTPKIPLHEIAAAVMGTLTTLEAGLERYLLERV